MLIVFRKSLIVVLAMLQLFAPLVHAHTGSHKSIHGLHIPGLELYLVNNNAAINQDVNSATNLHDEGFLVVVDAGIKNPYDYPATHAQSGFALIPNCSLPIKQLVSKTTGFSPHHQTLVFLKQPSPLSPRAPPA